MKSVFREIDDIQTAAKAHLSSLEVRITALSTPRNWIPADGTPGELISAARNHKSVNPTADLKTVRTGWTATIKKQSRRLDDLDDIGHQLLAAIAYVDTGDDFPTGLEDPNVAAACRTLRTAKEDGHPVRHIVDRATRQVKSGLAEIRRVRRDVVPVWKSTADIIICKFSGKHYEKCAAVESDAVQAKSFAARGELMHNVLKKIKSRAHAAAADRKRRGESIGYKNMGGAS